jgi:hypothetical protein
MRNTLRNHILVLIVTTLPILSFAQSNFTSSVADSTDIKGQFEYLYKKSNSFEQYKVIPIVAYNTLKQNATDSIQMYQKKVADHINEINNLNNKLETSNTEISRLKEELEAALDTKNSIKLLGIPTNKNAYRLFMWIVIFCLVIASMVLFLMYKRGHRVVKEARIRLQEVQEDFEKHRKNAIAREQALGHELQTFKLRHSSGRN